MKREHPGEVGEFAVLVGQVFPSSYFSISQTFLCFCSLMNKIWILIIDFVRCVMYTLEEIEQFVQYQTYYTQTSVGGESP